MNALTLYLLEASVCLGVFYLFYLMVLHRQPTFRYNRTYLLATSALGWILPLLEVPFGWGGGSPVAESSAAYWMLPATQGGATEPLSTNLPWWEIIYGLGVLIMLAHFAGQCYRLHKIVRSSSEQGVPHRRYRLLYTNGRFPTASFFRYLFWDNTQSLSVEETRQMMLHEETHIRQGHSYDTVYLALLKVFAWFHPLVYLYDRALVQTHEYAADAGVLRQVPVAQRSYARLLSKHTLNSRNVLLVNRFFYPSLILNRIHMIYATKKTPWYRYVLIAPVFASLFLVFSCQEETEMAKLDDLAQQYEDAETQEERSMLSDADEVFMVVEDQPTPEGGMEVFYEYIAENMRYPIEARQMGIEGKVFVQFVVEKDGSLTDIKVLKGIGGGCDEEAARVIEEAPVWNPGQQRGKFVKVKMVLPISFKISEGEPKAKVGNVENAQNGMKIQMTKQDNLAKGIILDESGNSLAGANLVVKGTTRGTVTNSAGEFLLQLEDQDSESTVVASFVGYRSKQVKL